jgi:hypothetical protein
MIDSFLMQLDGFDLVDQVDALGKLSPGYQHSMVSQGCYLAMAHGIPPARMPQA